MTVMQLSRVQPYTFVPMETTCAWTLHSDLVRRLQLDRRRYTAYGS